MRFVHTSDWHLGHTLKDWSRASEHEAFLAWLVDLVAEERADALLLAGDVFDTTNPGAAAEDAYFRFLASVRARAPRTQVIVVAGNHDSAGRLEAPSPVLRPFGVHVVGAFSQGGAAGRPKPIVEVRGQKGERAFVLAVPFLRPSDLSFDLEGDPLEGGNWVRGVRRIYEDLVVGLDATRAPGEPILAMGHLHLAAAEVSEWSERKIMSGRLEALPVSVFGKEIAYGALGHLHLAQQVWGADHVRYSGSPIPLSVNERGYKHQVLVVDFDPKGRLSNVTSRLVPRSVEFVRVPAEGALPLSALTPLLGALPARDSIPPSRAPFVEVHVRIDAPDPDLFRKIDDLLRDRAARLVRVERTTLGHGEALADALTGEPRQHLRELFPEEVFRRRWSQKYESDPPAELLGLFTELVAKVRGGA